MSEQTIDKLQIEIESKVNVSLDAFNKLSSSLNNLKKTIESSSKGFNSLSSMINRLNSGAIGNLKAMVASLNSMSSLGSLKLNIGNMPSSIERLNNSLSGASVANFSKIPALANGLKSLSSVPDIKIKLGNTISSIERLDIALAEANAANFNKLQTLAKALLNLSTVPAINLKFGTLAKNLNNLNSVLGVFDTRNVSKLYTLSRALSMMGSIPPINLKIGNLGTQINKLSTALAGISADSNKKIRDLASALTSLTTLPKMSLSLTSFIKSLDKLGSIDITKLATNIKKIDTAIAPLIKSLSKAPQISGGLGSLTGQLNKLSKVNLSSKGSDNKGFNSFLNLGKITGTFFAVKTLTSGIGSAIKNVNDYVENVNLFSVAMGSFAQQGEEFANTLQNALGLDKSEIMRNMGMFMQMSTSMGVAEQKAYTLSKGMTQLGYDISSFYNVKTEEAFTKLQAGLAGETEGLRRLGIDISVARLQQELYNLGINESVQNLSQADKAQLRYIAIMNQTSNAQMDMSNTLSSPANQLRVLQAQLNQTARSIGGIFIPALTAIMPYVIAVVKVIGLFAEALGNLVGFKIDKVDFSGLTNTGGLDDTANSLGDVGENAKKTKKELVNLIGGLDELNILQEKTDSSDKDKDKGNIGAGGILGDIELPDYSMLTGGIDTKVDEIVNNIKRVFEELQKDFEPTINSLKGLWTELERLGGFTWEGLKDFYNSFLKPVGEWVLGEGLPNLIDGLTQGLASIDWNNLNGALKSLWEALTPFAIAVGQGLIDFFNNFLVPVGTWVFNDGVPRFINALADGLKAVDWNSINDALNLLWKALTPFAINIGEGLLWFWENVLVPLGTWTLNEVVPRFLEALAAAIEIANNILNASKPMLSWLWEELLKPLAEWTGGIIVDVLDSIVDALNGLADWSKKNPEQVQSVLFAIGAGLSVIAGPAIITGITALAGLLAPLVGLFGAILSPIGLVVGAVALLAFTMAEMFRTNDDFKEKVLGVWEKFKEAIKGIGDYFKNVYDTIIKPVVDKLIEVSSVVWDKYLYPLVQKIAEFVVNLAENALDLYNKFILPLSNWFVDVLGPPLANLINEAIAIVGGFVATIATVISGVVDIFDGIIDFIVGVFTGDWDKALGGVTKILEGVDTMLKSIFDGFIVWWNASPFAQWLKDIVEVGKNVVQGFIDGIESLIDSVKTTITNLANDVIEWFKDIFGIHSPSTVFNDFGLNIIEGLLNGLKEKWKALLLWWNEGIGSWWKDDIAPWFTIEQWRKLGDGIKDSITEKFDAMKTWWNTNITSWWNDNVIPWFTLDKWKSVLSGMQDGFESIGQNIIKWWEDSFIGKLFEKASNLVNDIKNKFSNINIGFSNNSKGSNSKSSKPEDYNIPKLAKGGVLYEDSVVNVAEYSNAKSNPEIVAPQDIMYETVVDANAELAVAFYEVGKMIIEAINNKDSDIVIDGETITKKVVSVINNTTKRTGRTPLLVT